MTCEASFWLGSIVALVTVLGTSVVLAALTRWSHV